MNFRIIKVLPLFVLWFCLWSSSAFSSDLTTTLVPGILANGIPVTLNERGWAHYFENALDPNGYELHVYGPAKIKLDQPIFRNDVCYEVTVVIYIVSDQPPPWTQNPNDVLGEATTIEYKECQ